MSDGRSVHDFPAEHLRRDPDRHEDLPDGASFRVWAPRATAVYLNGSFGGKVYDQQSDDRLLDKEPPVTGRASRRGRADGDLTILDRRRRIERLQA